MSKKQKIKEKGTSFKEILFRRAADFTFLFCHGIGKFKLNSIAASVDKDGLNPGSMKILEKFQNMHCVSQMSNV